MLVYLAFSGVGMGSGGGGMGGAGSVQIAIATALRRPWRRRIWREGGEEEDRVELTRAWHDFHLLAVLDSKRHVGQLVMKRKRKKNKKKMESVSGLGEDQVGVLLGGEEESLVM
jgi:hypothetical protein